MQIAGVPLAVAPLSTGHPLGLPALPEVASVETKVQPVARRHNADLGTETGGYPPESFWRSLTGLPDPTNHVAPPSIMQIRISALLEKQAEHLPGALQPDEDAAASEPAETPTGEVESEPGEADVTETEEPARPAPRGYDSLQALGQGPVFSPEA